MGTCAKCLESTFLFPLPTSLCHALVQVRPSLITTTRPLFLDLFRRCSPIRNCSRSHILVLVSRLSFGGTSFQSQPFSARQSFFLYRISSSGVHSPLQLFPVLNSHVLVPDCIQWGLLPIEIFLGPTCFCSCPGFFKLDFGLVAAVLVHVQTYPILPVLQKTNPVLYKTPPKVRLVQDTGHWAYTRTRY